MVEIEEIVRKIDSVVLQQLVNTLYDYLQFIHTHELKDIILDRYDYFNSLTSLSFNKDNEITINYYSDISMLVKLLESNKEDIKRLLDNLRRVSHLIFESLDQSDDVKMQVLSYLLNDWYKIMKEGEDNDQ